MFGLNLLKIFILLSSIQIFMIPGVLCLPRSASQPSGPETAASSSNPALEVRGNLEKRDSWDCKGSSSCGMVKASACIEALEAFLRSNKNNRSWDKVWGPIRHWRSYNSYNTGKCLAMYTCGDSRDYESAARAEIGVDQFTTKSWAIASVVGRFGFGDHAELLSTTAITTVPGPKSLIYTA
ncbi:hypothetical protein TWF788_005965 [Orbilia oligospora]|uniref:Ecp2 effector protein domain-containing protein n=1 Tax=Orbilia oligospora TaxID=2813651 RepID=A0A7C8PX68_ORBOL|nr:hypothetical protein TWF788_005965 [Orbilia oligospora]